MKKILTIIAIIAAMLPATAQVLEVNAPESVYQGDVFTVKYSIADHAKDFAGPSFKGFSLISGPSMSSSTSMSIIGGQRTQSVSTSYTYRLKADIEGTFSIGPASCTVDGKQVSSRNVSIKVEKMSAQQQQQRQQQQQQQQQRQAYDPWAGQPQQASEIDDKSLFARASVSKSNPYQGEQVIITYKIYTQVPLSQFAIDKLPGNKGFWAEDLSVGQQIRQYEETVGDRRYQVAEIRRGALFAQESGQLTIEPLDLNVKALVKQQRRRTGTIWDLFDDPFFNMAQAQDYPLSTNRLNINVRPLPAAPDGFGGAVGRFSVKGGLNLAKVKANEAVSYRVTVSGTGNLMLIDAPQPQFPPVFEVYDPQIDDNIKKTTDGISGSRTYEWILIPRSQGRYTIPPLQFISFDPQSGQYVTHTIEAQEIEVEKGDGRATRGGTDADDTRAAARDINYIHPLTTLKPTREADTFGPAFFIAMAVIVALAAAVIAYGRKRQADELDVAGMRMKRATRQAQKRLKRAAAYLGPGNTDRFYEEIYKAIWGCLSDKYTIPLSQLNRDTVSACLNDKHVPNAQQEQIMKVLQDVDIARFAPGDAEAQKQGIYTEALTMIATL